MSDHFIKTVGAGSGTGKQFGSLLVLADATFTPESRFPMHPHQEMEILTWVVSGTLSHLDDKNPPYHVSEGELQYMSSRSGIYHAEGNTSKLPMRLLQIWIAPNKFGGTPVVEYTKLNSKGFNLLAAPSNAPITLRQNVWFYAGKVSGEESFEVPKNKIAYAVSIGDLSWEQRPISDGSGIVLTEGNYLISGQGQTVIILQDL